MYNRIKLGCCCWRLSSVFFSWEGVSTVDLGWWLDEVQRGDGEEEGVWRNTLDTILYPKNTTLILGLLDFILLLLHFIKGIVVPKYKLYLSGMYNQV